VTSRRAADATDAVTAQRAALQDLRRRLVQQSSGTVAGSGGGDANAELFTALLAERSVLVAELVDLEDQVDRLRDGGVSGPAALARQQMRTGQVRSLVPTTLQSPTSTTTAIAGAVVSSAAGARVAPGDLVRVSPNNGRLFSADSANDIQEETVLGTVRQVQDGPAAGTQVVVVEAA
jgi:hypothetical protein